MSALFKLAPPQLYEGVKVPGVKGMVGGWCKAIAVGGTSGETYEVIEYGRKTGEVREKQQPPLAPSRFAAELARRRFGEPADEAVVRAPCCPRLPNRQVAS